MIKIEITRTTEEKWTQKENVITKETPTQVTKQKDYGSGTETLFQKEYAIVEVTKRRDVTEKLLTQEIADEIFDIRAVIKAINGL